MNDEVYAGMFCKIAGVQKEANPMGVGKGLSSLWGAATRGFRSAKPRGAGLFTKKIVGEGGQVARQGGALSRAGRQMSQAWGKIDPATQMKMMGLGAGGVALGAGGLGYMAGR